MNNGILSIRENNSMSLSCAGSVKVRDGIVIDVSFKGYPRTSGDSWVGFFQRAKQGDKVDPEAIEGMLKFNGRGNVVARFSPTNKA